jgi:nucleoside-diphosphate-sugar epimerase
MNVLVTGADGYIGRALSERLCEAHTTLQGRAVSRLTLCDLRVEKATPDDRVRSVVGNIADVDVIEAIT